MLALALATLLSAEPAAANRFGVRVEVGGALIEASAVLRLTGTLRLGPGHALLLAEWNPWFSLQTANAFQPGVLDVGVGYELRFFDERMATVLVAGASTLLFESALDRPGATGPFFGVQPAVFRWPLGSVWLRLTPLSLFVMAPVLGSIPLAQVQFRSLVGLEW